MGIQMSEEDGTTLNQGEPHPAAEAALEYMKTLTFTDLMMWKEAFASLAIEGNRLAEVCLGTLNRPINHEPVSDRYLLGLAWTISSSRGKNK